MVNYITTKNTIINNKDWIVLKFLTFLYVGGDGEQGHNQAEAAIDAQKDLVQKAGLRMCVVHAHEDHRSHCDAEQNQGHQRQRRVPQTVILHTWTPAGRNIKGIGGRRGDKAKSGTVKTT